MLNEEDRANLAAYLDGELDEHSSQTLEAKLNQDPAARAEVDALRKAWSMLDFLPRPETSPSFTNRTMERLTLAMPRAALTGHMQRPRPFPWLASAAWAAMVLIGVAIGAGVGMVLWRPAATVDPVDQVLAHHARVVDNFRLYEPLINFEFLKSLNHPDVFGEEVSYDEAERDRPRKLVDLTMPEKRAQARAFLALPTERQDQIVKLDQDLFNEPADTREELLGVAQRYRDWFDQLGEAQRRIVLQEPDRTGRVAAVKELQDAEWMTRQPTAQIKEFRRLQGKSRSEFVAGLRGEDRETRRKWQEAAHYWDELNTGKLFASMKDLPPEVRGYVNEYLKPMLTAQEKERLSKADGIFPLFPQTLVELADKHPPALRHAQGPKSFGELPKEVRDLFKSKKTPKAAETWPGFAMEMAAQAIKRKVVFPKELWPTSEKCLRPPMRDFLDKLNKELSPAEVRELLKARGKWPEYPEAIQKLARAHKTQPPWFTLPGPRELWDVYRVVHKSDKTGP